MKIPGEITFSVVVPFYNEEQYILRCLESLVQQSLPPGQIIAVDNGSTDKSAAIVHDFIENTSIPSLLRYDPRPGKSNALETGCKDIQHPYVLTADADIVYPPHFFQLCSQIIGKNPGAAAVMGLYLEGNPERKENQKQRQKTFRMAQKFPTKCHTGGAGQVFKASALLQAGGFSMRQWPYVLLDHEVIHRIHKLGPSVYHPDLYVIHTDRRKDRQRVRWNLWERLLYRYHPNFLGDWYFYKYLARRSKKNGKTQGRLREQPWQT